MINPCFFAHGLPYKELRNLRGSLIAIEGTDRVGCSAQIAQLKPWLEVKGYAVASTHWTRSPLLNETIEEARAGHRLNATTFALLYAADFADRLENEIIPALEAGQVVLAERYMYSAFARNKVMGADPEWTRSLFGFALVPDLVMYLKTDVDSLIPRALQGGGLDYWESGMHLGYGQDLFDSFRNYQRRVIREFNALAREFNFVTVDARAAEEVVQAKLRARIGGLLTERAAPAAVTALRTSITSVNGAFGNGAGRPQPKAQLLRALRSQRNEGKQD